MRSKEYSLIRDVSNRKIEKNQNFLSRMEEDIHNRFSKEKILNVIVEATKPKIDENRKLNTFNRLISDANRRLEKYEKLEQKIKEQYYVQELSHVSSPKVRISEWSKIYKERFQKFQDNKNKKLKDKKKEKLLKLRQEEDIIVASPRLNVKASILHVEEYGKKLHEDANKRKMKVEQLRVQVDEMEMLSLSPTVKKINNLKKSDKSYSQPKLMNQTKKNVEPTKFKSDTTKEKQSPLRSLIQSKLTKSQILSPKDFLKQKRIHLADFNFDELSSIEKSQNSPVKGIYFLKHRHII